MATQPSDKQKLAGNYAKEHRNVAGMRVSIENKAGTDRSGTDKQGNAWKQTLFHDYGYIRGTRGNDKDHIDAFLGPAVDKKDVPVYVIDQGNEDGSFDEHKVMMGFNSEQDATDAYHANYEPGWRGFQDIKPLSMTDFKNWAFTDGARKKPIAMCKGGSVEPQAYQAGGVVKALAKLWHGGTYAAGSEVTQPLFTTANKAMAATYIDMAKDRGMTDATLKDLSFQLNKAAPESVVRLQAQRVGIDPDSATPAGMFDAELHGPAPVRRLTDALRGAGYDHSVLDDVGYGGSIQDKAHVIFPGLKGYADGGVVENEGGAAFLSPNAGKRRNNDRTASADMPVQAARGWAAGTLGLPGDIEGLARSVLKAGASPGSYIDRNMDSEPALPTSDFYKEWLPGADPSPNGKAAAELGSLFGGVGAGRAARQVGAAAQGAGRAVKGALTTLGDSMAAARPAYVPSAQLGAVKMPGGNWIPENLDNFVQTVKGYRPEEVDPVGGWMDKQFKRYVQNDMGTVGDPLLALEKEGRLHMTPDALLERSVSYGKSHMPYMEVDNTAQFPIDAAFANSNPKGPSGFHLNATGRDYRTPWENLSDEALTSVNSSRYSKSKDPANEWIRNLPEGTELNRAINAQYLGFDHVRDYMDQATQAHKVAETWRANPALRDLAGQDTARGLIDNNLHIDPAKLSRMSVSDMVGKTSDWDKLLAKQKAGATDVGIKQVHKQYDNGQQWVELAPEGLAAEGSAMSHCVGGYCSSVEDGSKRILSLRGKDGKPMVTVEVAPQVQKSFVGSLTSYKLGSAADKNMKAIQDGLASAGDFESSARKAFPQEYKAWVAAQKDPPLNIAQIKGPANRKPSAEAMAQVQDLVKGNVPGFEKWGHVGDLGNTDLINGGYTVSVRHGSNITPVDIPEGFNTRADLLTLLKSKGVPDEIAKYHSENIKGYAQGGLVPLRGMTTPGGGRSYQNFAPAAPTNLGSGYMFSPEFAALQPGAQGTPGYGSGASSAGRSESSPGNQGPGTGGLGGWAGPAGMAVGAVTGSPAMGSLAGAAMSDTPGPSLGRAALGYALSRAAGPLGVAALGMTSDDPMGALGAVAGGVMGGPLGALAGGWIGSKISDVANNVGLRSPTRTHMTAEQQAAAADFSANGDRGFASPGTTGDFSRADRAAGLGDDNSGDTSGGGYGGDGGSGSGNGGQGGASGRGSNSNGNGSNSGDGHGFKRGGPVKRNKQRTR